MALLIAVGVVVLSWLFWGTKRAFDLLFSSTLGAALLLISLVA
jgi:hypothetical protein